MISYICIVCLISNSSDIIITRVLRKNLEIWGLIQSKVVEGDLGEGNHQIGKPKSSLG